MAKGSPPAAEIPKYHAGIQFILAHSADNLTGIRIDKKIAWTGAAKDETITINKPDLFGGSTREGGVTGQVDVEMGELSQGENSYLATQWGSPIPAFRGLVSVIFKQVYLGHNYYLKTISFELSRIHTRKQGLVQWEDALAEALPGSLNGIHIIRDVLTDTSWGRGLIESKIDDIDFKEAAQICFDEGLGFDFFWLEGSIGDFLNEVSKHIHGNIYEDRTTGKLKINLMRELSQPEQDALIVLDYSNTYKVDNLKRTMIEELPSTITIGYTDRVTGEKDSVSAHSPSLAARQDTPFTETIKYSGISNRELALRIAIRELQFFSVPPYTCTISCDKVAENLNVGQAFKLDWDELLPAILIMRVTSIDLGTTTKQKIVIEAEQDIFHAADIVYTAPIGSQWVSPINDPIAVALSFAGEAPYYEIARYKSDSFAQEVAANETFFFIVAAAPTPDSTNASLWVSTGGDYIDKGGIGFTSTGTLSAAMDREVTTLPYENFISAEIDLVGGYVKVNDEFMEVTAITASDMTVIRGVLDTIPESHTLGDRVWNISTRLGSDFITYLDSETLDIKLTPTTPKGTLDVSLASIDAVILDGRMHKPYPPANVTIETLYYPTSISITSGSFDIAWATRNRLQQTANLIGYYTGDITTEPGVTYTGELIRTDTLAVLDSFTGNATTTATFTTAYVGSVKLTLFSVRSGIDSLQSFTHTFTLTA